MPIGWSKSLGHPGANAWPGVKDQLIVLDGKEPRHGSGASILSAVTSSQHTGQCTGGPKDQRDSLARELFNRLEFEESWSRSMPYPGEAARALVLEHGADDLLTV